MTTQELNAYEAKFMKRGVPTSGSVEKESDLHEQILAECRRRGWIAFHSRMDVPTTANVGTPDFICAIPNGITLYFECKARTGKLSQAQLAMSAWMSRLNHTVHTIRSFDQFILICEKSIQEK